MSSDRHTVCRDCGKPTNDQAFCDYNCQRAYDETIAKFTPQDQLTEHQKELLVRTGRTTTSSCRN